MSENTSGLFFYKHSCVDEDNHGVCVLSPTDLLMVLSSNGDLYVKGKVKNTSTYSGTYPTVKKRGIVIEDEKPKPGLV